MIKYFEIRDVNTFCPVMAVKMSSDNEAESFLLGKAGFKNASCVQLQFLNGMLIHLYPHEWKGQWSQDVHKYIEHYFDSLVTGQVIDMEFVRAERDKPRISERFDG